ncbi:MAG: TM2 domain-containing protein [Acidobacteria bacterium]|nr:TM2 domain-containing protein [Acidobacteriota bacterium]
MIGCPSCGAENVEGTRFCVKCGTTLPASPQPEQWRQSGDLGQQPTAQQDYSSSGYSSPDYSSQPPPSSGYPSYTPQQNLSYQPGAGGDWKAQGAEKKMVAGILGILLGGLGVHKFYLGYNTEGIIMLAVCIVGGLLTCGLGSAAVGVIGLIEGIIYLTKSDEEFVRTYIQNKKAWF